jgi:hypothetical protein
MLRLSIIANDDCKIHGLAIGSLQQIVVEPYEQGRTVFSPYWDLVGNHIA